MNRAAQAFAVTFALALSALCALGLACRAHAGPLDRLYPYGELSYHAEKGLAGRPWIGVGVPLSLGRVAPSIKVSIPLKDEFAVGFDVAVRVKFGH